MTHPYRERPAVAEARAAASRLDMASLVFGLGCALVGQALAGPACSLVVTVVGVLLLLRPPPGR